MLGILRSIHNWQWAGFGKHPVVKDYFQVGKDHSLMNAFLDWVKKGYFEITSKDMINPAHCSWRFWARIPKRESVVCGLLRDSSDSIGRPYPLLVVGIGLLKGWEENWDLLPFSCEATWQQTEYLSTSKFMNINELEDSVLKLKTPENRWSDFINEREPLWERELTGSLSLELIEERIKRESEQIIFITSLDDEHIPDQFTLVSIWHYFLKRNLQTIPNAVFMGGTTEKAYLVVFKRPLQSSDFVLLWSIPLEGTK